MSKTIVIASGNAGKLKEIAQMLEPLDLSFASQKDYDVSEAEETGLSFVENALIKARNASQQTGLPSIADDSGIVVDALQGAPGIYSARYAGVAASDEENLHKLLTNMQQQEQRSAAFVSVMVYVRHAADPLPIIAQGIWQGCLTESPQGANGFGYDPIFYVVSEGCTSAELSKERKNELSHRGKALRALLHEMRLHKV